MRTPFTVTTDNGSLESATDSGTSVGDYIVDTQLRVNLIATQTGQATITLTGPCGLTKDFSVGVTSGNPWGDLDCSGEIGTPDVQRSLEFTASVTLDAVDGCPSSVATFDVDCGGTADGRDALVLLLHIASLQPTFQLPVGCPEVGS